VYTGGQSGPQLEVSTAPHYPQSLPYTYIDINTPGQIHRVPQHMLLQQRQRLVPRDSGLDYPVRQDGALVALGEVEGDVGEGAPPALSCVVALVCFGDGVGDNILFWSRVWVEG
jgi:hypothetical protein